MNTYYTPKAARTLEAKLAFLRGPGLWDLCEDIAAALVLGNEHDRLRGLSRYGQPQAPVKTRAGKYRGASGPPLAPFGAASRVVTNYRVKMVVGKPGEFTLLAGWQNVVSKKGLPFLPWLDEGVRPEAPGASKSSKFANPFKHRVRAKLEGEWKIPPRPIFGISPNTWQLINPLIREFKQKATSVP